MLQLENQTPFKAAIAVLPDRFGIDTLYVIVKATVALRPSLSMAEVQVPPTIADEYYGDPADSSLKYGSEMHIGKSGTDVLLIGSAWAAGKRPVTRMQVTMSVAGRQKTILVTGDRVWRDGQPSDPKPFESMPLVWERAFGGVHRNGEKVLAEERNPIGCGFAGGRSADDMQGLAVPNLEDPEAPLAAGGASPVAGLLRADCAVVAAASRVRRDLRRSVAAEPGAVSPGRFRSALLSMRGAGVRVRPVSAGRRTRPGCRRDARWSDRLHRAELTSERGGHCRRGDRRRRR